MQSFLRRHRGWGFALLGLLAVTTIAWAGGVGKVTGTITGADGKPAAGAGIKLTQPATVGGPLGPKDNADPNKGVIGVPTPNQMGKPEKVVKTGKTDPQGQFTLDGVPEGKYACIATMGAYTASQAITVENGKTVNVNLKFEKAK